MNHNNLIFTGVNGKYGRTSTIPDIELQKKISQSYGVNYALVTTSGMSAINQAINTVISNQSPLTIIYDCQLYSDTNHLFMSLKIFFNDRIKLIECNMTDELQFKNLVDVELRNTKHNILIFAETVSNPYGRIFPLDFCISLRSFIKDNHSGKERLTIMVDNTWMSPAGCNPFNYPIDIVVESMTKYYSSGTAIGGVIVTNRSNYYKRLIYYHQMIGEHRSPYETEIISKNFDSIEERYKTASAKTKNIIVKLYKHGIRVIHPLFDYPDQINKLKYIPPIFVLQFKIYDHKYIFDHIETNCFLFEIKTSYGAAYSKIDKYITDVAENKFSQIRIAIGYDINENIEMMVEQLCNLVVHMNSL